MLVLRRRAGEKIWIGDDVRVSIEAARGPVSIGIAAPPGVAIVRDELVQRCGPDPAKLPATPAWLDQFLGLVRHLRNADPAAPVWCWMIPAEQNGGVELEFVLDERAESLTVYVIPCGQPRRSVRVVAYHHPTQADLIRLGRSLLMGNRWG